MIKRFQVLYKLLLTHVFELLLFHPNKILIIELTFRQKAVQLTGQSDIRVGLNIVQLHIRQLLFGAIYGFLVHYLGVQLGVIFGLHEVALGGLFNPGDKVWVGYENLFLLVTGHVGLSDLLNNLFLQDFSKPLYVESMLCFGVVQKLLPWFCMYLSNVVTLDDTIRSFYLLCLDF